MNLRGVAGLGMLAVGLGVGAALTHPPVASADSSNDWLSSIDTVLAGGALPTSASGLDLAISFDGYSLVSEGSATAYTSPGEYGLAIAAGSDAYAYAAGGTGDVAVANGTNALAEAGGALTDTGANYDTAIDIGNNVAASTYSGTADGAWAGNGDLVAGGAGTGAYDTAIDIGNNTNVPVGGYDGGDGGYDGSFAGASGTLFGAYGHDGNNDTAIDIGDNAGRYDGANAVDGNGDYASETGSTAGEDEYSFAGDGNDNTAVADVNYTITDLSTKAYNGDNNYAFAEGPENSYALDYDGNHDIAYVLDPLGSTASYASDYQHDTYDLAAVLFADGSAALGNADDLYDILTAFGSSSGSLADLLSLF